LLALVFLVLLGSFVVATVIVQRTSSNIGTISDTLVEKAMPRIAHVATLRSSTLEVQLALAELLRSESHDRAAATAALDTRLAKLQQEVGTNLLMAPLPGEQELSNGINKALERFEAAVLATRSQQDARTAKALFQSTVLPAAARLGDAAMNEIEFNAMRGRDLAMAIRQTRRQAIGLSYVLTATCVMVGLIGVVLVGRRARHHMALVDARVRHEKARANELEHFAGRVAHDIRNPLAAASLAAELLDADLDTKQHELAMRLRRSLERAGAITDGLLEFARAGAKADPGARTNVRSVINDVAEGVTLELERARIELRVEPGPDVLVACSTGVYLSLVGNLVRNAIKYMGQRDERRITIRVRELSTYIRTEVIDSGPGIAPEVLPRIFEPYFRATNTGQAGLGLGLATVRKLVEGHGGHVGVESKPGIGSTFWFDLPLAGVAWDPTAESHRSPRVPSSAIH
jgi:signal transduction histidine kinase